MPIAATRNGAIVGATAGADRHAWPTKQPGIFLDPSSDGDCFWGAPSGQQSCAERVVVCMGQANAIWALAKPPAAKAKAIRMVNHNRRIAIPYCRSVDTSSTFPVDALPHEVLDISI